MCKRWGTPNNHLIRKEIKMIDSTLLENLLKNQLFKGLSKIEMNKLKPDYFINLNYKPGDIIIRENDKSNEIFLIIHGIVNIQKEINNKKEVNIITRQKGDIIGELGLIENKPRASSIICKTEVEIIKIERDNFFSILNLIPKVNFNINQIIASRFREAIYQTSSEISRYQVILKLNQTIVKQKKELEKLNTELASNNEILKLAKEKAETATLTKSLFLANMSHELRTPLNVIIGFSELMSKDKNLTKEQQNNLSTILNSGEHLLSLINDVLEFSKIELGHSKLNPVFFNFYEMIKSIEDMLQIQALKKGLELKFYSLSNIPQYIRGDKNKIRQILINLLGNAIKFTEKGRVQLRISRKDNKNNTSLQTILLFEVKDTGIGIPKKELEKIFEIFFQTNEAQKSNQGTGLGLPISKKFINMMGGDIKVKSTEGKGSTFSFDIKIEEADCSDIQTNLFTQIIIGVESNQINYRLLVVDDDIESRKLLVNLLKSIGFNNIKEAVNGKHAIETYEKWNPRLIWMDIQMPVMDGYKAAKYILKKEKQLNKNSELIDNKVIIIALTAFAFDEDRNKILKTGFDAFLRKPFREHQVYALMKKHLGINFIYENNQNNQNKQNESKEKSIDYQAFVTDAVKSLPAPIFEDLKKAVNHLDFELSMNVIHKISKKDSQLAEAVEHFINDYRFDILQDIFEK